MCKTKSPSSAISSGSFIKDFDFVKSEIVTTRQEWSWEGGLIAVARWWAVGPSKVWVWLGVWCSVVSNVNIPSSSKQWWIGRAAVEGISFVMTILSRLIELQWLPTRLVYQWEEKGPWVIVPLATTWFEIHNGKRSPTWIMFIVILIRLLMTYYNAYLKSSQNFTLIRCSALFLVVFILNSLVRGC